MFNPVHLVKTGLTSLTGLKLMENRGRLFLETSQLHCKRIEVQMIKSKSGHRSDAVRAYKVPDVKKRKTASDILTAGD